MARKILCVDDLGEGFCYDSTTEKIDVTASGIECTDVFPNSPNDCGGAIETVTSVVDNGDGTYTYTNEVAADQIILTENTVMQAFDTTNFTANTDHNVTVPSGVSKAKIRIWGAGGASGGTLGKSTSGAGGSGGYIEALISVTPADIIKINLGSGGQYEIDGSNGQSGNLSRVYKTGSFDVSANGGGGGIITDFILNGAAFNGLGGIGGSAIVADATDILYSEILEGESGGRGGFLYYDGPGSETAFLPFPNETALSTDISALTPPLDVDGFDYQYAHIQEIYEPKGGVPPYHPGKWGRGGNGRASVIWTETWDNHPGTDGYITIEWL